MVHERSASQSVRRVAIAGDRARRLSGAAALVVRGAPVAAAVVCVVSVLAMLLGGPRMLGPILLGVTAAAGALMLLAARRDRSVSDALVSELDRAADLGGAFRSAYWFADPAQPVSGDGAASPWITFHLEKVASRVEVVDWKTVYARPSARRRWLTTTTLALATLAFAVWPGTPRFTRTLPAAAASSAPEAGAASSLPSTLIPTLVEGMRAMKAGQAPSREALSAIGQALEIAKANPTAQKQIEGLFAGGYDTDQNGWTDSDPDRDPRDDGQFNNGFQLAALDWAYQEAVAKLSVEERTRRDARREASSAEAPADGKTSERDSDTSGTGALPDAPVQADVRGQAASFSSVLFGNQQASGEAGLKSSEPSARAATLAVLRQEVVHARTDTAGMRVEAGALRRATNAAQNSRSVPGFPNGVTYDRARASQPPAVPEARRSLVHDFFLRPAMPR
jgi:hypothetical protein